MCNADMKAIGNQALEGRSARGKEDEGTAFDGIRVRSYGTGLDGVKKKKGILPTRGSRFGHEATWICSCLKYPIFA